MRSDFTLQQSLNDPLCLGLAIYVAEYLNDKFKKDFGDTTNFQIVRSIRTHNAFNVAIDQLPLLRVFRLKDIYTLPSAYYQSVVNMDYWLPIAAVETLPGLSPYVAESIIEAVISNQRSHKFNFPENLSKQIEVEYTYQQSHTDQIVNVLSLKLALGRVPCGSITRYRI